MNAVSATPEEAWTGKRVGFGHLRVFGCRRFVYIRGEKHTEWVEKSKECIFMGYYETKGYRLFDPHKPTDIVRARDLIFIEEKLEICSKSVMNVSHKEEIPMHLLSNKGSEGGRGQTGDSDCSDTMEINSTSEEGEIGSDPSES
jgi:hypothetical protein